jgi:hypothetical protein
MSRLGKQNIITCGGVARENSNDLAPICSRMMKGFIYAEALPKMNLSFVLHSKALG